MHAFDAFARVAARRHDVSTHRDHAVVSSAGGWGVETFASVIGCHMRRVMHADLSAWFCPRWRQAHVCISTKKQGFILDGLSCCLVSAIRWMGIQDYMHVHLPIPHAQPSGHIAHPPHKSSTRSPSHVASLVPGASRYLAQLATSSFRRRDIEGRCMAGRRAPAAAAHSRRRLGAPPTYGGPGSASGAASTQAWTHTFAHTCMGKSCAPQKVQECCYISVVMSAHMSKHHSRYVQKPTLCK